MSFPWFLVSKSVFKGRLKQRMWHLLPCVLVQFSHWPPTSQTDRPTGRTPRHLSKCIPRSFYFYHPAPLWPTNLLGCFMGKWLTCKKKKKYSHLCQTLLCNLCAMITNAFMFSSHRLWGPVWWWWHPVRPFQITSICRDGWYPQNSMSFFFFFFGKTN